MTKRSTDTISLSMKETGVAYVTDEALTKSS